MTDQDAVAPYGEEALQRVSGLLQRFHASSADDPIEDVDPVGAFPVRWFRRSGYPIVVDANVLRNDVLYSCRTHNRTTLVNASNAGLIRPFIAPHVVAEMHEHAEEWTAGSSVSTAEFLTRWQLEYLPLMRVVEVPSGLLDPDEAQRVQRLATVDPDDVPSATLALLVGAFFLSEDRRASEAVYGRDAGGHARREWLDVLRAGSDAGQVTSLIESAALATVVAGTGLAKLVRLVLRHPWLLPASAALVATTAMSWSPERSGRLRSVGASLWQGFADIAVASSYADAQFRKACVPPPDWNELADRLEPKAVLIRRLVFDLARASDHRSAEELSSALFQLPVSHSETTVRTRLRQHPCFVEVYQGRWQLGARWQGA